MSTARDFCTLALKIAGVLGVGQTALAEDINDTFTLLTNMMAQWQKKRWLVPSLYDIATIGNNAKSNTIGPGQYWNAPRPDKIQAAYFVQLTNLDPQNPVSFPLRPIFSYENYAQIALKEMNSWPLCFFYDAAYPYGNVFIWPIPSSQYEIHLILKSALGFVIQLQNGEITNGGAGYVDGVYPAVPFTSVTGVGNGGTAEFTVNGGEVTIVNIDENSGDGYEINDILSVDNADLGGTGEGFLFKTTNVTSSLDAEFNMPEEYNDAILFNLAKRLRFSYTMPPKEDLNREALVALNTLRKANVQIPTLSIPAQYRNRNSNNFYIFNADTR